MSPSEDNLLPADLEFSLPDGEVQTWCIRFDRLTGLIPRFTEVLSVEERQRAEQFHFDHLRRSYTISHGVLRTLLGRYLAIEPGAVVFHFGRHGKPSLDSDHHQGADLKFNLAHSGNLSLCSFVRHSEIGVDLEYVDRLPDTERIAARAFSGQENAQLAALPSAQRIEAFYNCWTRKEAYVKALGGGLSLPLDQFSVSLAPGEPARLLHVVGEPEALSRWSLASWTPAPGYVAALAVERICFELRHYQLPAIVTSG